MIDREVHLLPKVCGSRVRGEFRVDVGGRGVAGAEALEECDAGVLGAVVVAALPSWAAGDDAGERGLGGEAKHVVCLGLIARA